MVEFANYFDIYCYGNHLEIRASYLKHFFIIREGKKGKFHDILLKQSHIKIFCQYTILYLPIRFLQITFKDFFSRTVRDSGIDETAQTETTVTPGLYATRDLALPIAENAQNETTFTSGLYATWDLALPMDENARYPRI